MTSEPQTLNNELCRRLIYIEEADLLVPGLSVRAEKDARFETGFFSKWFRLIRSAGGGFLLVSSVPLRTELTGNAHYLVLYSQPHADLLNKAASSLSLDQEGREYFLYNCPRGFPLIRINRPDCAFPFPAVVEKPEPKRVLSEAELRNYHNKSVAEVLPESPTQATRPALRLTPAENAYFEALVGSLFENHTRLTKLAELGPSRAGMARDGLLRKKAVEKRSIKGSKAQFLELTAKSLELLGRNPYRGHGSWRHRYYQHILASHMNKQRYRSEIEGLGCDVLCTKGEKRLALEVTLSFDNVLENLRRNNAQDGLRTVFVVQDTKDAAKAERLVDGSEGASVMTFKQAMETSSWTEQQELF